MPPDDAQETLLAFVDAEDRDLLVESLRAAADQRRRAAMRAASELADAKADGADIRSRAVKLVDVLAAADTLTIYADQLAIAEPAGTVTGSVGWDADTDPADGSEAVPPPDTIDPDGEVTEADIDEALSTIGGDTP